MRTSTVLPKQVTSKDVPDLYFAGIQFEIRLSRGILTEGFTESLHVYVEVVWSLLLTYNLVSQRT